ncbi:transposase [Candidatus Enterovibrio escicola]|nr:transposase [Candidatus Enterovibrio escacola]
MMRKLAPFICRLVGKTTGIACVYLTKLQAYHNSRIPRYRLYEEMVKSCKGTMGRFYSFKLHLIINDQVGMISVNVIKHNVDNRKYVPNMADNLLGSLYGDKRYRSGSLEKILADKGVSFITNTRKNMKSKVMKFEDRFILALLIK